MFLTPVDFSNRNERLERSYDVILSYVRLLLPPCSHFQLRWLMIDVEERKRLYFTFGARMIISSDPYRTLLWIAKHEAGILLNNSYEARWSFLGERNLATDWWYLLAQWRCD